MNTSSPDTQRTRHELARWTEGDDSSCVGKMLLFCVHVGEGIEHGIPHSPNIQTVHVNRQFACSAAVACSSLMTILDALWNVPHSQTEVSGAYVLKCPHIVFCAVLSQRSGPQSPSPAPTSICISCQLRSTGQWEYLPSPLTLSTDAPSVPSCLSGHHIHPEKPDRKPGTAVQGQPSLLDAWCSVSVRGSFSHVCASIYHSLRTNLCGGRPERPIRAPEACRTIPYIQAVPPLMLGRRPTNQSVGIRRRRYLFLVFQWRSWALTGIHVRS